jgi:hypothetical protein
MQQVGASTRFSIRLVLLASALLAVAACGPKIVSGDENTVYIQAGPTTGLEDVERSAKSYCDQFGKYATLDAGDQVDTGDLQTTYRYNCVDSLL